MWLREYKSPKQKKQLIETKNNFKLSKLSNFSKISNFPKTIESIARSEGKTSLLLDALKNRNPKQFQTFQKFQTFKNFKLFQNFKLSNISNFPNFKLSKISNFPKTIESVVRQEGTTNLIVDALKNSYMRSFSNACDLNSALSITTTFS